MKIIIPVALLLLTFSLLAEEKKQIQASDVGLDVEIIGQLGHPLWSFLEVEATVIEEKAQHGKDHDKHVVVIHSIEDIVLKSPIEIILLDKNIPSLNKRMRMEVVETGRLTFFTTPSLSSEDDPLEHSRQRIFTGLKINKIHNKIVDSTPGSGSVRFFVFEACLFLG